MPSTTTLPDSPPSAAPTAGPPTGTSKARDPFFDNAKFVLVALVVVGHSLTLLPKNTTNDWLYDFLYAWHVPAFVLITGYLSRSFSCTPTRMWALIRTVVVPYVTFEALLAVFRTQVGGEQLENLWTNPHWPMWYLSALFFWRVLTPVFKRIPLYAGLPLAILVSLSAGYWAGDTLDLSRVFGLLPFFVLGLGLKQEQLERLRRPWVPYAALGVLATILAVSRFTDRWISTEWLYYRTEYTDLGLSGGAAAATRLVVIMVGLAGAFAVLSLIPSRRTWFTSLGAASLVAYLFHGFFIKGAEYAGVPDWAAAFPVASLLVVPVVAVLLATALSVPVVATRLDRLVDPIGSLEKVRLRQDPAEREMPHERVPMSVGPR